jgi:hypothetical protein
MFQAKPILEQRSKTTIIKRVLSGQVSFEQAKVDWTGMEFNQWVTYDII